MANVVFSRKALEKHVKITDETEHLMSMMGTTVESVSASEIELEITPDRPDLLSMEGYIRAFLAFTGKTPGLKEYKVEKPQDTVIVEKSTPNEWPFAFAFVAKGLKLDDARIKDLIQVQEKIGSTMLRRRKKGGIGLYPLEKISFPITFKGMKPTDISFRPLESSRTMTAPQILRGHPTGRTYASLLDGWNTYPVFVDNNATIMSMPPIINSHDVGKIDESTTEVFVEATGTEEHTLKNALTIIATTLADMGATIHALTCIQKDGSKHVVPNLSPQKRKLSLENTNKLLGTTLTEKDVAKLLPKMGLAYEKGVVTIPAWRTDVLHEVDLIEDVAIALGYDTLIPKVPNIATTGQEARESVLSQKIAEVAVGLGCTEIATVHLIKPEEAKRAKVKCVELEETKTEYKVLRPSLSIPALRILAENKDTEYPHHLFEIGTVFTPGGSESGVIESQRCCIALSPSNVTQAKQLLDALMRSIDCTYTIKDTKQQGCIEGRTGAIVLDKKQIGYFGEVHPNTLKAWGCKMPVALIEFELAPLFAKL